MLGIYVVIGQNRSRHEILWFSRTTGSQEQICKIAKSLICEWLELNEVPRASNRKPNGPGELDYGADGSLGMR